MRNVPLILSLFTLIPGPLLQASHVAGGEITYEHIGPGTMDYKITLTLIRNDGGINMGPLQTVHINSSCYPNTTLNVTKLPGNQQGSTLPGLYSCIDSGLISSLQSYSLHQYEGIVTLPGTCADWQFVWNLCCLPNDYSNILNPGANPAYARAQLNNVPGPNSSPQFDQPGGRYFCINDSVTWFSGMKEPDGDSVWVIMTNPLTGGATSTPTPISFLTGYSATDPVPSLHGFQIDLQGNMSFTATSQEVGYLATEYIEYRQDSTGNLWIPVGRTLRNMVLSTVPCNYSSPQNTSQVQLQLAAQQTGSNTDSLTELPCNSDRIRLKVTGGKVTCSSIDSNGTDFVIYNSHGQSVPVRMVLGTPCSQVGFADSLILELGVAINYDDTLIIETRMGHDLNTLIDQCGRSYAEFDSIAFHINSCGTRFSTNEHSVPPLRLFPNPVEDQFHLKPNIAIGNYHLRIWDMWGRLIANHKDLKGSFTANASGWKQGMYLVEIQSAAHNYFYRIQKH